LSHKYNEIIEFYGESFFRSFFLLFVPIPDQEKLDLKIYFSKIGRFPLPPALPRGRSGLGHSVRQDEYFSTNEHLINSNQHCVSLFAIFVKTVPTNAKY
jgi:hypothetical protein